MVFTAYCGRWYLRDVYLRVVVIILAMVKVEMHPLVWSTDDIQQDLTSAEFLSWSRENGVVLSPKIQVALLPDRSYGGTSGSRLRGVVAVDDIALGERLCLLPLALGLYYKRGDNLTAGVEAEGEAEEEAEEGEGEELPGWALAARTLLQERAKQSASRWAPYIASLPPVAPSPLAMDAQEMESIQWAPMIAEARSLKADVRRAYARLGGGPSLASTLEQFEWAVSMVLSRAFTLPVREGEEEEKGEEYEEYVLMPFMDLINHHHDNNADWMARPIRDGMVEIVAKKPIRRGDEVLVSFGARSNDNLFLYYGFVLEENPFDAVPLFSSFQESVKWYAAACSTAGGELDARPNGPSESCREKPRWEEAWAKAAEALEQVEASEAFDEEAQPWWDLVSSWGDLGYEYLPYRSGPNARPGGLIDPALLTIFAAVCEHFRTRAGAECLGAERRAGGTTNGDCSGKQGSTVADSNLLKGMCSLEGCQRDELVDGSVGLSPGRTLCKTLARDVVQIRCRELLASLPSTAAEDIALGGAHRTASQMSNLAVHYRLRKKGILEDAAKTFSLES